jgi:tetratricopeptide (TPR) repeat protein
VVLKLTLDSLATKAGVIVVTLSACALLVFVTLSNFIIGALADERISLSRDASTASFIIAPLTDDRVGVNPEALTAATDYFRNSPRLHARLAQAEMMEERQDLAESHARRAISLSPHDYTLRLLLTSIEDSKGNPAAAEESVRAALTLAPNSMEAHWYLANLLLRDGRLPDSLNEFRIASASDTPFLSEAFDRIWEVSGDNVEAVQAITGSNPKARLTLARFLLEHSRVPEAVDVFSRIDRNARLDSMESSQFLNALIDAGRTELARNLWVELMGNPASGDSGRLIWNGSFESDILVNFAQFDWRISPSNYASISIDTNTVRTGARSLRIDFIGRDTTRLDQEITQLIVVHPGARYRLECYAKSEELVTPEGPRAVVTTEGAPVWIAASDPVAVGTNDWRHLVVDFIAPQTTSKDAPALRISIKRKPKFSYDAPTRGSVWFDDFVITEIQ